MMRLFLLLVLLQNMTMAFAISNNDCKKNRLIQVKQQAILNKQSDRPQVYYIQNISNEEIMLDHPHAASGVKAGWSSLIAPQHWSAINVSQKDFGVSCTLSNGKYVPTSCSAQIKICKPSVAVKARNGNFWLIENVSHNQFKKWLRKQQ